MKTKKEFYTMAKQHSTISAARQDKTISNAINILQEQLKQPQSEPFDSVAKTKDYLMLMLGREEREVFTVLFLDAQSRLTVTENLFYGTLTQTSVYPREVVKKALLHNAASVIFAHNHPSGMPEPSKADISLTEVLTNALSLVDVRVLDHIIVGANAAYSFTENKIVQNAEKKEFEIKYTQQPIKDISNSHDYGSGVGNYIEAFANDDKEVVSSIGYCVAESAFSGLATVGKLIAYSDLGEIESSDIGWLIVMLAELGANASSHSSNAAHIKHRIEAMKPIV